MKEMSIEEHLGELRKVAIRVVAILITSFVVCYAFGENISEILLAPLRRTLSENSQGQIVYLGLLDKIVSQFQVAFWASILFSSPLWFREIWSFIRPALYEHELKVVRPFFIAGFFLFILGVLFGQMVVFPYTFKTILEFGVADVTANISLREYLLLSSKVLLFLGVLFQIPNILVILGFMGLVTKYSLKNMRPYLYVGFAVVSGILTPPDVFTLMALWIPMVILFELGVFAVSIIVHPYLAKVHS